MSSLSHPHRYRIAATLVVETPLHVGSGEMVADVLTKRGTDGVETSPNLAVVVRDHQKAPFLPGSTLKNLLRRVVEGDPDPERAKAANALFGEPLAGDSGRMGAVFVWGAACERQPEPGPVPYGAVLEKAQRGGSFVAARTRIDPHHGTADDNKLFFQEMVTPGTRFALRLLVVADEDEVAARRCDDVLHALGRLAAGAMIGKGQADGLGRVSVPPERRGCWRQTIGSDGALGEEVVAVPAAPPIAADVGTAPAVAWCELELHCPGPFLVVDSSHTRDTADKKSDDPHLKAQRLRDRAPLLLGSTLTGALRARAGWLAAQHGLGADDPDKTCRSLKEAQSLSPVERLFGVTGFRGLLEVEALKVFEADAWSVTSVKLDRFSGAPFDGGLFTTEAFIKVKVRVRLVLRDRRLGSDDPDAKIAGPDEDLKTLAQLLIEDVRDEGLMLGHGTNKGFGWFTCATVKGSFQ